ncbi:MAG: hypothetical protein MUD16_17140 [Desulfobacterales bacterium]|jgi:hypothetical protein|nr:hypothetical protein [Desulfobacterales bacterium]
MSDSRILQKLDQAKAREQQRLKAGADATVAGWQCFLEGVLIRLEVYLHPGRLVTFQSLTPDERRFFEELAQPLDLPPDACAVFIPPSVLQAMLFAPESGPAPARIPSDAGIVLVSRCRDYVLILNTLFAMPPYAAGIDVYEEGRLLAGYSYRTIDECRTNLPRVIRTYFKTGKPTTG